MPPTHSLPERRRHVRFLQQSTTDHVFGLCHLLGFRFAPRIKDLKERKLYSTLKPAT